MSDFTVDVQLLKKLADDLKGCADDLDGGLQALKKIGPKGLGFDFLDDSCAHFQDKWEYGLKKVRECVETLDEGLRQVQKNYADTEQANKESMGAKG